ncbi:energy transducer TonB [Chryseobacterium koreense]
MKHLFQNQENKFDEVLFQGRNKDYGAYVLRNEADSILTKSMLIGIGVFALFALTPLVAHYFADSPVTPTDTSAGPFVLDIVDQPEDTPPVVQPVVPPQAKVNTLDSRVPDPTRDAKFDKVMPKQADYDHSVAGIQDVVGDPPLTQYVPPVIDLPANQTPDVKTEKPVDNTPKTAVDVSAEFIGGINAFRNKVVSSFDTSAMDGTGEVVKTTVTFIVEKDGTISDVKASGPNATFNREAEKTIRSVRGKWIPAKLGGENVRSYFKFPVTMQFQ